MYQIALNYIRMQSLISCKKLTIKWSLSVLLETFCFFNDFFLENIKNITIFESVETLYCKGLQRID